VVLAARGIGSARPQTHNPAGSYLEEGALVEAPLDGHAPGL
jgi:hypothetical protein